MGVARMWALVALAVVLAVSVPGTAHATHVACGDTLMQDTRLDSDLVDCPARGVVIGADGVDLNLAGHTISGASTSFFGVEARAVSGIRVRNGTVSGFNFAVLMSSVSDSVVAGLTISARRNGIYFSGTSARNRIAQNTVTAAYGIELDTDADDNVVARNSITARINGIEIEQLSPDRSTGNVVKHNHLAGGGDVLRAVYLEDTIIAHNTVDGGGRGLVASGQRFEIRHNTVSRTSQGFTLAGVDNSLVKKNMATDNTFQGFVFYDSDGTTLSHNVASRNGTTGIDVLEFDPVLAPHTLAHNVANDNGTLGISALPETIDGGRNRASGNGDPRQCVNIRCK